MDERLRQVLAAIDEAEREVAAAGPIEITPQHWRDVEAVMALPENQDGADKSLVWRVHEFCWHHFRSARLLP